MWVFSSLNHYSLNGPVTSCEISFNSSEYGSIQHWVVIRGMCTLKAVITFMYFIETGKRIAMQRKRIYQ
jgi:hypothetical protein